MKSIQKDGMEHRTQLIADVQCERICDITQITCRCLWFAKSLTVDAHPCRSHPKTQRIGCFVRRSRKLAAPWYDFANLFLSDCLYFQKEGAEKEKRKNEADAHLLMDQSAVRDQQPKSVEKKNNERGKQPAKRGRGRTRVRVICL